MNSRITKRPVLAIAAVALIVLFIPLFQKWKTNSLNGGQKPAEPFRIAGNLYYVGANDVTSFLITSPQGHVLIDGGYPGTAPMIMQSIAKLGFNIRDVKILLNSHWHLDHAGGLAALQKASGAELWVSERDANTVANGGAGDPTLGPFGFIMYLPGFHYPAPRVDHRFKDGAKVRLGPIELTAHVTAGHTRGCTSWAFPVHDSGRDLLALDVCGLELGLPVWLLDRTYPEFRTDFEHTFATLRGLPVDIFLTTHARKFGRWRKFQARATAKNPADPFIDRKGYLELIDQDEKRFRLYEASEHLAEVDDHLHTRDVPSNRIADYAGLAFRRADLHRLVAPIDEPYVLHAQCKVSVTLEFPIVDSG